MAGHRLDWSSLTRRAEAELQVEKQPFQWLRYDRMRLDGLLSHIAAIDSQWALVSLLSHNEM